MHEVVLRRCQAAFPEWRSLTPADFHFDEPKGFSSVTVGVRVRRELPGSVSPPAVLYRQLEGKDNAILDHATERDTFLLLGEAGVAARCYEYHEDYRLEEFYVGRTLMADDVFDPETQRGVADALYQLHQLTPENLPGETFFELLFHKWGAMARSVLIDHRAEFPEDEQRMCADLEEILAPDTLAKVLRCLPERPPVFCHNDTYHGNVMLLEDGTIKLLDFEFSCLNHIAFDFANLFAETVMEHGFAEPPHFKIGEPRFTDADLASLIGYYVDNMGLDTEAERAAEVATLVAETRRALLLSDYMYAMAALPLALEPIQKIRFIPYAHQRFHKFIGAWDVAFG